MSDSSRETHPPSASAAVVRIRRTFGWGIAFLRDSDESGLPTYDPSALVATAPRSLSIAVRHEQDVDTDGEPAGVAIDVHLGPRPPSSDTPTFDAAIDLPSGRLEIGDADASEVVELSPGRWSVTIAVTPDDHPEQVDVWLVPLAGHHH